MPKKQPLASLNCTDNEQSLKENQAQRIISTCLLTCEKIDNKYIDYFQLLKILV